MKKVNQPLELPSLSTQIELTNKVEETRTKENAPQMPVSARWQNVWCKWKHTYKCVLETGEDMFLKQENCLINSYNRPISQNKEKPLRLKEARSFFKGQKVFQI